MLVHCGSSRGNSVFPCFSNSTSRKASCPSFPSHGSCWRLEAGPCENHSTFMSAWNHYLALGQVPRLRHQWGTVWGCESAENSIKHMWRCEGRRHVAKACLTMIFGEDKQTSASEMPIRLAPKQVLLLQTVIVPSLWTSWLADSALTQPWRQCPWWISQKQNSWWAGQKRPEVGWQKIWVFQKMFPYVSHKISHHDPWRENCRNPQYSSIFRGSKRCCTL